MKSCKGQSDSYIISVLASWQWEGLAYLSKLERSCEPQSQALGQQLETFQSKQRGFYEEGVNGYFLLLLLLGTRITLQVLHLGLNKIAFFSFKERVGVNVRAAINV